MSFANALQKAVDKVAKVKGMGVNVVFRRVTPGSYNTSTGVVTNSTTDETVKGIFQSISDREVNDRKCLISAAAVSNVPTTKDQVVYDGIIYQIISVETVAQAGIDLSYDLVLRA
jgi:hypothetical protein